MSPRVWQIANIRADIVAAKATIISDFLSYASPPRYFLKIAIFLFLQVTWAMCIHIRICIRIYLYFCNVNTPAESKTFFERISTIRWTSSVYVRRLIVCICFYRKWSFQKRGRFYWLSYISTLIVRDLLLCDISKVKDIQKCMR